MAPKDLETANQQHVDIHNIYVSAEDALAIHNAHIAYIGEKALQQPDNSAFDSELNVAKSAQADAAEQRERALELAKQNYKANEAELFDVAHLDMSLYHPIPLRSEEQVDTPERTAARERAEQRSNLT